MTKNCLDNGGYFSHSAKLEKLRLEEQKAQERSKRNAIVVEELYGLILEIFEDVRSVFREDSSSKDLASKELDRINRCGLLLNLYLPTILPVGKKYIDTFRGLAEQYSIYLEIIALDPDDVLGQTNQYPMVLDYKRQFMEDHHKLRQELEKLVI